jgi:hypothetical protein|nr:MAG TPA: hypothetical protein [Caudoviricetes sp.]
MRVVARLRLDIIYPRGIGHELNGMLVEIQLCFQITDLGLESLSLSKCADRHIGEHDHGNDENHDDNRHGKSFLYFIIGDV